jgi:hypothetical protein
VAVLALLAVPTAFAQSSGGTGSDQGPGSGQAPEVSGQELESFASALQDVQSIRQSMAQETQKTVQDSDMDQQRFEELYRSKQGGSEPSEAPTDAENQQFNAIMSEIQQIQKESNQQMVQAVKEEGLTVSRFNQIAQAIQRNPDLQQQFQQMQGGSSGQSSGTGS